MSETASLMDDFYFGCDQRAGHYLFNRWMQSVQDAGNPTPWRQHEIDGDLAPHLGSCTRRRHCGCVSGVQGVADLHHLDGWTALAFWDRSVDKRGASNSNFLMRGVLTYDEAVERAKVAFPKVWQRFTFEVVPCPKLAVLVAAGVA